MNDKEKKLTNPVKAIRAFCVECCGGSTNEVKLCQSSRCALHPFRLGKNPYRVKRELTEDQRLAAAERLKKARKEANKT